MFTHSLSFKNKFGIYDVIVILDITSWSFLKNQRLLLILLSPQLHISLSIALCFGELNIVQTTPPPRNR